LRVLLELRKTMFFYYIFRFYIYASYNIDD